LVIAYLLLPWDLMPPAHNLDREPSSWKKQYAQRAELGKEKKLFIPASQWRQLVSRCRKY
jgi:hypothetical protein